MARPKGSRNEKKIEKVEVKEAIKPIEVAPKSIEDDKAKLAEEQRTIVAQYDTDKANKDILIKNAKELHAHIVEARKELDRINHEVENGYKAAQHVQDEIKAQNYNLSRQNDKFEKENAEKLRILEIKEKEVVSADLEYKKLSAEVNETKKTLGNQLKAIYDERIAHKNELNRLNTHVSQIESSDSKLLADIEEREGLLKEAMEAFELERDALQPELKRISEIKNENFLLLQKLEEEKVQFERQKGLMDAYKKKLDEDALVTKASYENKLKAIQNEDGRLRKWEQDLKDEALELKAMQADASKQMKRYQLTAKIGENTEV